MHSLGRNRHVVLHIVWHKHLFLCAFQTRNDRTIQMERVRLRRCNLEDPHGLHRQRKSRYEKKD